VKRIETTKEFHNIIVFIARYSSLFTSYFLRDCHALLSTPGFPFIMDLKMLTLNTSPLKKQAVINKLRGAIPKGRDITLAEPKPFIPVKLICGIIASADRVFEETEKCLVQLYGTADHASPKFQFDFSDYYAGQMGKELQRKFLSFAELLAPEELSNIKIRTNALEKELSTKFGEVPRAVNLDPGYVTRAALIMATAKDFAHRIPLNRGIYAHLEFLFRKDDIRLMDWTYPDYREKPCQRFFLEVRRTYLCQLRQNKARS